MNWKIDVSKEARADLDAHFAHLRQAQLDFGYDRQSATRLARDGIATMLTLAARLAAIPYAGTHHPNLLKGIRHVSIKHCVFWFRPDEETKTIEIFAIFRGGQNHFRHILARLSDEGEAD